MDEIQLYKLLTYNKHKLKQQQYLTIKGQIKKKDYEGAYKGIMTCLEKRKKEKELAMKYEL